MEIKRSRVPADKDLLFKRKQYQADNGERLTWCVVEYSNQVFRAQLQHMGRGKFKILNDNQEGIHIGQIIDASDILNCESS
jgi:hypothetical protein